MVTLVTFKDLSQSLMMSSDISSFTRGCFHSIFKKDLKISPCFGRPKQSEN
ncbi:uncharacterized protein FFNC_15630 [Fusarium fujikuroi]|nr:uncharacterized protein FFNC_15630 [Fusarium fujikuroi]